MFKEIDTFIRWAFVPDARIRAAFIVGLLVGWLLGAIVTAIIADAAQLIAQHAIRV